MKLSRIAIGTLIALAVAGCSFYAYGALRTMQENVGLAARPALVSAAGPLVVLAAVTAIVIAGRSIATNRRAIAKRTVALLAGAWLCGCAVSEAWILADERSFVQELAHRPAAAAYARARNWPNQECALVYIPHRGIHATD